MKIWNILRANSLQFVSELGLMFESWRARAFPGKTQKTGIFS